MPDARSALQLNGIPIKGIVGSGKSINTYYAAASTPALASFTTEADITGATVSVVVPVGGGTVIVVGSFDIQITGAATILGFLNWNGSDQTQDAVFTNVSGLNNLTVGQTWIITGVAAGTYTAKLRASSTVSNASNKVNFPNTNIAVLVIGSG